MEYQAGGMGHRERADSFVVVKGRLLAERGVLWRGFFLFSQMKVKDLTLLDGDDIFGGLPFVIWCDHRLRFFQLEDVIGDA